MAMLNPYQKFGQAMAYKNVVNRQESGISREKENAADSRGRAAAPIDAYKQNKVLTAAPEELTLMLYDGALRFITQSRMCIESQDIQKAHESNLRAQDIILEFISTLNKDYEISDSLVLLYDFMYRRLIDANMKKDTAVLDEVYGLMKELRDTWAEAVKLARKPPKA